MLRAIADVWPPYTEQDEGKVKYSRLEDLRPYVFGIIRDYAYTDELWRLFNNGPLRYDGILAQDQNMKKLALGRIDIYPEEKNVGTYSLANLNIKKEITCLPKPLKSDGLHAVFSKASVRPETVKACSSALVQYKKPDEYKKLFEATFNAARPLSTSKESS